MDIAIYKITNTISGKFYFGQTVDPKRRWYTHKYTANKGVCNYKIYSAMRKYGLENFTFEVVHWCEDKATADEFEKFVIAESGSRISGYNIAPGGEGAGSGKDHPAYGVKRAPEFGERISKNQTGRLLTDEWKKAISASLKDKPKTAEHAAKAAAAQKGKKRAPLSEEHKAKLREAGVARKPSEACVAAAANANLGKKRSSETINKMRQAALGRKRSPEIKAKISASMKALRAKQREVDNGTSRNSTGPL